MAARTKDAERSYARRSLLLEKDPEKYREQNRMRAERQREKRRHDAEAKGLAYKPRTAGYTPRTQESRDFSTDVPPPSGAGLPATTPMIPQTDASLGEQWEKHYLPGLAYEDGTVLPSAYVQSLKMVGAALHTWGLAYPLLEGLFRVDTWDCTLYAEKTLSRAHLQFSAGFFAEYQAARAEAQTLSHSAVAATSVYSSLQHSQSLCPVDGLHVLTSFMSRFNERLISLRILSYNLDLTRRLFLGSARPDHVKLWLTEAVESAVRQGYKLKSPPPTSFVLDGVQIARFAPGKWLSGEILNFMGSIWNEEHVDNDALIFSTTFALLHLDLGKTYALRDPERAIRHGRLKDAANGRLRPWSRLLIPIETKKHFVVLLICTEDCSIVLYDSLVSHNALRLRDLLKLRQSIADFVSLLCKSHGWPLPEDEWDARFGVEVPQQTNSHDCGVFAIMFMRHLSLSSSLHHDKVPLQYRFPHPQLKGDVNGPRLAALEEIMEKGSPFA